MASGRDYLDEFWTKFSRKLEEMHQRMIEERQRLDQILLISLGSRVEPLPAEFFGIIAENYFNFFHIDGELKSCSKSISDIYRQSLRFTSTRPDWSQVNNRRAYIARFFTMHSFMVYKGLEKSLTDHTCVTENWKRQSHFHMCCIGGGPGSDVVGMVRFLKESRLTPAVRIQCTILDLYVDWKNEWDTIQRANYADLPVNVTYLHSDMKSKVASLCASGWMAIRSADIVTIIKSFSPVAAFIRHDPTHGNQLRQVFREMKPGALVLYIDNCYGRQHEEFRGIARSEGVRYCLFEWHGQINMPTLLSSDSIGRLSSRTGVDPQTNCIVSIMLLRK